MAKALSGAPVALVTGAGSGIGRATATLLSQAGYRLVLVGRREGALEETGGALKGAWLAVKADVGNATQMGAAIDRAVDHFGSLDSLINNAGFAPRMSIGETTPAAIDETFRINALGPSYAIARAWPIFVRQKRGCIVNVSTMGTLDPFEGFFAYAGSKAAVNLMARSCAKEGAEHGIKAFAVAPGAVETEMLRANFSNEVIPTERCLTPEAVARVIVECVMGKRDGENGGTIRVESP